MRVAKWGSSLAIRLPVAVVKVLQLKAGDEIEICIAGFRIFEVQRDRTRDRALARVRRLRHQLPAGFALASRENEHAGDERQDTHQRSR